MQSTSLFLLSAVKVVLAELQQADLITSEECEELQDISGKELSVQQNSVLPPLHQDSAMPLFYRFRRQYGISGVVRVQKGKSPEVMTKSAEVLRRHGFEKESRLLAGKQSNNDHLV